MSKDFTPENFNTTDQNGVNDFYANNMAIAELALSLRKLERMHGHVELSIDDLQGYHLL